MGCWQVRGEHAHYIAHHMKEVASEPQIEEEGVE